MSVLVLNCANLEPSKFNADDTISNYLQIILEWFKSEFKKIGKGGCPTFEPPNDCGQRLRHELHQTFLDSNPTKMGHLHEILCNATLLHLEHVTADAISLAKAAAIYSNDEALRVAVLSFNRVLKDPSADGPVDCLRGALQRIKAQSNCSLADYIHHLMA